MANQPRTRAAQNKARSQKKPTTTAPATTEVIDDSVQPGVDPISETVQDTGNEGAGTENESQKPAGSAFDGISIDREAAARARKDAAARRTSYLENEMAKVANASDNPGLDKLLGNATNLPESQPQRPEIYDMIDRTVQPFVEEMAPNARLTEQRAGELHYSMSTLIKYLLNAGGNEMKVGVPYLLSYYRKYKGSVFHPQNHHRGVGAMRGTDADIDFYRNMSRLLVDISHPDDAALVLSRTDVARFRKLTMAITSPAAQRMSENLVALISRVHAR